MISDAKISFRKVKPTDLKIIRDWRNSSGTREFNTQFTLLNMVNQKKWYESISKNESDREMFMIVDKDRDAIGICGLINIKKEEKSAEIAIILGDKKSRGRNLGSKSLSMLLDYGFKKLKLHRIGAEILEFNKISVSLFEGLNFKYEATLRDRLWRDDKWWDVYLYSILDGEF